MLSALVLTALLVACSAFRSPLASRSPSPKSTSLRAGEGPVPVFVSHYEELSVPTLQGIHLTDITSLIQSIVDTSGMTEGQVAVLSRHTTTAITINEMEGRLVDDVRQYLWQLAPPTYPYLHNDLHLRSGPPDWPGGNEAWRAQEPVNAHAHLLNMLLGSSAAIPVHQGKLKIGTWQSVIMVELDGPRTRSVAVQLTGIKK